MSGCQTVATIRLEKYFTGCQFSRLGRAIDMLASTYLGTDDGSALDDGALVGTSDPTEGPRETLGEADGVELMTSEGGIW